MNFYQHKTATKKPRALAISTDAVPSGTPVPAIWTAVTTLIISLFKLSISLSTQTDSPHRKLKLQLLTVYAAPSLFFFGASGIILIGMYFCIFELVLAFVGR
ncbi:MAG: hypothetical protein AAGN35_20585 [Bacteroidota bacterium]